jgi:hypothetical protein
MTVRCQALTMLRLQNTIVEDIGPGFRGLRSLA